MIQNAIVTEDIDATRIEKRAAVPRSQRRDNVISEYTLLGIAVDMGWISRQDADRFIYKEVDDQRPFLVDLDKRVQQLIPAIKGAGQITKKLGQGRVGEVFLLSNDHVLKIADDSRGNMAPFVEKVIDRLHKGRATKNTPMIYDWGRFGDNWIWIEMGKTPMAFPSAKDVNPATGKQWKEHSGKKYGEPWTEKPKERYKLAWTGIMKLRDFVESEMLVGETARTTPQDEFVEEVLEDALHYLIHEVEYDDAKLKQALYALTNETWFQEYVEKFLRAVWDAYQSTPKGQMDLHTGNFGMSRHGDEFVFFDPVV